MPDNPTIKRRQLSNELRRLRAAAGMTVEQAADALEWSRARLGHIETGRRKKPLVTDVSALLDLYAVAGTRERQAVLDLVRQARETSWWARYDDVLSGRYVGFEAAAAKIGTFQPSIIPGLLQTPDYTRDITKATLVHDELDVERSIETRQKRQEILASPVGPELWVVVGEEALLRLGDGDLMRSQVRHLVDASEDTVNSVTVQVLGLDAGLHAGMGGRFVILDFEEGNSPIIYLETETDGLFLEEPQAVERYRKLFLHTQVCAMNPQRSLTYLKQMLA